MRPAWRTTWTSMWTTCKALTESFKDLFGEETGEEFPAGPAGAAQAGDPRGLRLLDRRPRRALPAHQPDPRRVGHGGQRAADGVRQQGRQLVLGRGLLTRRDDRGARLRQATSCPTPRVRTWCPGVRTPHDLHEHEGRHAGGLRRADGDPAHARSATTRTCRTPSSPSRRARSTCSRRATPSGPRRRPCASRSMRSRRACSIAREALCTIDAGERSTRCCTAPSPATRDFETLTTGVAASPGAAKGEIVFTADDAVAAAEDDRQVILVRPFTEAEDVAGFHAAEGILTSKGGKASHAALVARGMGKPCVAGAGELEIDLKAKRVACGRHRARRGRHRSSSTAARASLPPTTCELEEPEMSDAFETVLEMGRRAAHARRAGQRRHRRRTRPALASSAPRESGCAAASTSSWAPSTSARCRSMIMAENDEERGKALDDAALAPAGPLRGAVRGDGGPAGHDPAARPATARVHPERRGTGPGGGARPHRGERRPRGARAHARAGARRWPRPTRCWAPAAFAWACCNPRCTRCRCARSCARAVACARRRASRRCSR